MQNHPILHHQSTFTTTCAGSLNSFFSAGNHWSFHAVGCTTSIFRFFFYMFNNGMQTHHSVWPKPNSPNKMSGNDPSHGTHVGIPSSQSPLNPCQAQPFEMCLICRFQVWPSPHGRIARPLCYACTCSSSTSQLPRRKVCTRTHVSCTIGSWNNMHRLCVGSRAITFDYYCELGTKATQIYTHSCIPPWTCVVL